MTDITPEQQSALVWKAQQQTATERDRHALVDQIAFLAKNSTEAERKRYVEEHKSYLLGEKETQARACLYR